MSDGNAAEGVVTLIKRIRAWWYLSAIRRLFLRDADKIDAYNAAVDAYNAAIDADT